MFAVFKHFFEVNLDIQLAYISLIITLVRVCVLSTTYHISYSHLGNVGIDNEYLVKNVEEKYPPKCQSFNGLSFLICIMHIEFSPQKVCTFVFCLPHRIRD